MKKNHLLIVFAVLTLCFTACKKSTEKELSFLTFNVWQEGTSVKNGLSKICNVIKETNADVVCFVEVRNYKGEDWTSKVVKALNNKEQKYYRGYIGGDVSFISKFPLEKGKLIYSESDKGTVIKFDLNVSGKTIVVAGMHLDYTYYACYLPRGYSGGYPNWEIIKDENNELLPVTNVDTVIAYSLRSKRDEAVLTFAEELASENRPIFLMGDFNEPSVLDWTARTKNLFDHNGAIIPWFCSEKLKSEGFKDAFRTIYPNEVKNPGFTWPSYVHEKQSTSWTPISDERDRVDYIYYKGKNINILDAALVGPKASYIKNEMQTSNTENENFLLENIPWPSDHKAVYAKVKVVLE